MEELDDPKERSQIGVSANLTAVPVDTPIFELNWITVNPLDLYRRAAPL
jgi:hypothetical protein